MNIIGIDIGGTKCSVILGKNNGRTQPSVTEKSVLLTKDFPDPYQMIRKIQSEIESLAGRHQIKINEVASMGISCGGPLDSREGVILSPPNLLGWNNIPIVRLFKEKFNIPVFIQNDANACALAEWKFGAGRNSQNLIFMTFGTGLGAGLILNGKLYSGTNDNAGEVGHIRLCDFGPVGYGKTGSFEGFCSGGGIAQLARIKAQEKIQMGMHVSFCNSYEDLHSITAEMVAHAADNGDELAKEIYRISGSFLGKGLAILIDILNPEIIVIGSIFERSHPLLTQTMYEAIASEALPFSSKSCRIVPAALGDHIGDFAALSVAVYNVENTKVPACD